MTRALLRRIVVGLGLTLLAGSGCTEFIEPTTCAPSAPARGAPLTSGSEPQGTTACSGIHDARFCDDIAVAAEGADCAALGLGASKHFCVVTPSACVDADAYAVKGRACNIVRLSRVRDSAYAEDCPPGAPFFVSR